MARNSRSHVGYLLESAQNVGGMCPRTERARHPAKGLLVISNPRRPSYSECDASNTTWSCHHSCSKNLQAISGPEDSDQDDCADSRISRTVR